MLWIGIVILFFVFALGATIGGLFAAPRVQPRPGILLFFALLFLFVCFFGMLFGILIPSWFSWRITEFVVVMLSLVFIVAAFSRFHPTLGFIYFEDKLVPFLLVALFFLIGVEAGLFGFRVIFVIFSAMLFSCALFVGLFIQQRLRGLLWRHSFSPFVPLIWLLFVSMLKLL